MVKTVGRYKLGKTIGSGTYGKVKHCVDSVTGRENAVKIIEKQQLLSEGMEEQLRREITIMKALDHPNITKIFEVMQSAKNVYIVLELVTGGELFNQIVAAKRFEEPVARCYFQQLILGLRYCHKHGICHRDLKPENLLLDSSNNLKIVDFGLSNFQPTTTSGRVPEDLMLHTLCGTPHYVAPEVLEDQGYNGFIADIWSCGVILYVMLAGKLPFNDKNRMVLYEKIKSVDYQMSPFITPDAADLIRRMLTKDPKKRINNDEIIAHPWFQVEWDPARLNVGNDVGHVDTVKVLADPFTQVSQEEQGSAGDDAV
eukprot:TRINITY_DN67533_c0_g1_i1.p2 TRINITY_DN67533_c0_g1~~TRINITY_DN67533_c0_g1_i1.p2  ORF type:complete len:324 (-),score=78.24 TRINITY_DN67533_c0_g1_i1:63-1001(-)